MPQKTVDYFERNSVYFLDDVSLNDLSDAFLVCKNAGRSSSDMNAFFKYMLHVSCLALNEKFMQFCLSQAREHPEFIVPADSDKLGGLLLGANDIMNNLAIWFTKPESPYFEKSEVLDVVRYVFTSRKVPTERIAYPYHSDLGLHFEMTFGVPF